jgi:ribosomal-protein-alanine N-acetyltransferase
MIRGNVVSLRAIEQADASRYYGWINDEETNLWRGLYHPMSLEEATAWISNQRTKNPEFLSLSIEAASGEHIGFIGLRGICARSRRAEIWIYIGAKTFWNQGIGEDSIRTLCNYAFVEMNLVRIWLECDPEFAAGLSCYLKVGFQKEGTHRKGYFRNGKFRDTCTMALLRDEPVGGESV